MHQVKQIYQISEVNHIQPCCHFLQTANEDHIFNPALKARAESKKDVLSLFEGNKNKVKCSEIF
jgi:hypothetical protein